MTRRTGRSLKVSSEKLHLAEQALLKFAAKADLAAQLQMSRSTVHKFFQGKPVDKKSFHAICKKLKLDWDAIADLPETAATPQPETSLPTPQNNLPWAGATKFVGRDEELARLHQLLQESDRVAIAAISGMGGVGKTELAIQYAQRHLPDYPGGACWIFAKAGDVGLQVIEFARSHFDNFFIPEGLSAAAQVSFCWQRWHPGKVLVVLDDVDKYDEIKDYLPPQSSRFKVLITTRLQGLVPQQLSLEVLSPVAALNLLAEQIGAERISATKGKGFAAAMGASAAEQLCEWLGYLPLGIQLVGRYLAEQPDLSLEKMLARLQRQKLAHSALIRQESDGNWNLTAQRGIKAAFELTWQRLDEQAQQLGCLLSIFALAPIPWAQVESVVGQIYLPGGFLQALMQGSQGDAEAQVVEMVEEITEAFAEARATLVKWHLLQRADVDIYRLHQLVREFFRDKLAGLENGDSFKEVFCQVMVAVAKQIPEQPTIDLIEEISPAIPHLAETATTWQDFLSDEDLIKPFVGLGNFYEGQGLYTQAEPWCKQCLSAAKNRFGETHVDVATSLNNLAALYQFQGRYSEAEPLCLHALELWKQLLGEIHVDVATSLNNLAEVYRIQGRYSEAEPLHLHALELWKQLLGEIHPDVATSLNNLAALYESQGRHDEAEPLYLKSLEIMKQILGEVHLNVANALNNLAFLYKKQGRYNEAETFYIQALEMRKKMLGEIHPDVAVSLNNLAALYESQGRYSEAETLYIQALENAQEKLELNHPYFGGTWGNIEDLHDVLRQEMSDRPPNPSN
jgi:tetratricopeptide (TPR) repeat protein